MLMMHTKVHREIVIVIHGGIMHHKIMKGRDSAIPEVEVKEAAVVVSEESEALEEVMESVEAVAAFTKRLEQPRNLKMLKTSKMVKVHTEAMVEEEDQEVLEVQEVVQEAAVVDQANTGNLEVEAVAPSQMKTTTSKKLNINQLMKVIKVKIALNH